MKIFTIIVAVVAAFLFAIGLRDEDGVRVYDCGMAEWHPDIPKEVKEECRRRAYEYWKEQQRKASKIVI